MRCRAPTGARPPPGTVLADRRAVPLSALVEDRRARAASGRRAALTTPCASGALRRDARGSRLVAIADDERRCRANPSPAQGRATTAGRSRQRETAYARVDLPATRGSPGLMALELIELLS